MSKFLKNENNTITISQQPLTKPPSGGFSLPTFKPLQALQHRVHRVDQEKPLKRRFKPFGKPFCGQSSSWFGSVVTRPTKLRFISGSSPQLKKCAAQSIAIFPPWFKFPFPKVSRINLCSALKSRLVYLAPGLIPLAINLVFPIKCN